MPCTRSFFKLLKKLSAGALSQLPLLFEGSRKVFGMDKSLHNDHVLCLERYIEKHLSRRFKQWLDEPGDTNTDEFEAAWKMHENLDKLNAKIQTWEHREQNAPIPSEALAAEQKLAGLRAERDEILSQLSGSVQEQAQPVQAAESERLDHSMLAYPDELIAAFGSQTGMKKAWFSNLTDKPGLMRARRIEGMKGRGGYKPLFCPLEVMLWLTSSPRKVGTRLPKLLGWQLLQRHFPKVYAAHADQDPRETSWG